MGSGWRDSNFGRGSGDGRRFGLRGGGVRVEARKPRPEEGAVEMMRR